MIVDSSAVLAIVRDESDAASFGAKIAAAPARRISVANLLEAAIVVEARGGAAAGGALDEYLESAGIEFAPVTAAQTKAARLAWRRFGRGNHPAALNFGDCFAYALAKTTGEPLLFKGADFARTDIAAA